MGAMKLLLSFCSIVRPMAYQRSSRPFAVAAGIWRICHIVTASIAGRAADRSWTAEQWVAEEERQLQGHGFLCESLDLAGWPKPDLAEHLASFYVLYVQGGNTFYLLEEMRRSGADGIIQELVAAQGVVYSPSRLEPSSPVRISPSPAGARIGTANEVEVTDLTGLHLVPFILSPHYVPEDASLIAARLPLPHPVLALRDGQAWVVDGEDQHLIGPG